MTLKHQEAAEAGFQAAYQALNLAQRQAVDTIDGPVMVIAGPGTGKTQILTLRIANILRQTDTAPESILALTFTESGVVAMRERLTRYLGARAYEVPIHTFHGFCGEIIRRYPEAFDTLIGSTPAADLDKITMVQSILTDTSLKRLRPTGDPTYYVRAIITVISEMKREYVSPDDLRVIITSQEMLLQGIEQYHTKGAHKGKERGEYRTLREQIEKNLELCFVYRQYETMLRTQRLHDFEDMIIETVRVLANNEDVRLDVQERYQYVLADEHQDVNGSQNRILELLCNYHERPNIFVVGDEKQAIYRFQGASLENFLYFEDQFQGTTMISLTENYRSTQPILDLAHRFIAVEEGPLKDLRIALTSNQGVKATLSTANFQHEAVEDAGLVAAIKNLIGTGVRLTEIAVIVRSNREVERLAHVLASASIPTEASSDANIIDHPVTKQVLALLDAAASPERADALFTVLHGAYWGIDPSDLMRVCAAQRYDRPLAAIVSDEAFLESLLLRNLESITRVAQTLARARERAITESPQQVLQGLLTDSGFLDFITIHDPLEAGSVVRRIYDEVERLVVHHSAATLQDVSALFATLRAHGIAVTAPYVATGKEAVQVMTAHRSKGLEFEHVFLPGCTDNVWGSSKGRTTFHIPLTKHTHDEYDELDDERRLLYVALTRAKKGIHISYATLNREGKERAPSRLLTELDTSLLTTIDTEPQEAAFLPTELLVRQPTPAAVDVVLLRTLFLERGFSATSLNNFIDNPWNYIYRNILRIPEAQATHLLFGTAVHSVLERVSNDIAAEGVMPSDNEIISYIDGALKRLPLSPHEFVALKEKGIASLLKYINETMLVTLKSKSEVSIKAVLKTSNPLVPEIPLTGKFDRVDLDAEGNFTRVVDYKTGSPKSRNEIEGNTASSDGAYKRQLTFYALLLSLQEDERMHTKTATLSFVEPTKTGVIKEETFTISSEETEALKEVIIAAALQIVSGDVLSTLCEKGDSDYCHLVHAMFLN